MLLPIRTDSPLRRTPWMNWGLIAANVFMFAVQQVFSRVTYKMNLDPTTPSITDFVTYAFLHGNAAHLLGNMLFLYIFGNNVNDKLGNVGYLGFYLASAVFAGVSYELAEIKSGGLMSPVIGVSGVVAAVTGAYLVLVPRSHITVVYLFFFIGT